MLHEGPVELRLLLAVLMNVAVFAAAARFCRRMAKSRHWLADALLLVYLVQYLSICVPGIAGVLNIWTILLLAAVLCIGLWLGANQFPAPANISKPRADSPAFPGHPLTLSPCHPLILASLFLLAFLAALVHQMAYAPSAANDALTYHLPAAADWLQSGPLRMHETWFFNPANTFSPLAGSAFIAWLMAPLGNDALARFVQTPAAFFLFVAMYRMCRSVGAEAGIAALIALAAACSRAFVSQAILAKDDLFVAAFFLCALDGFVAARKDDSFAPWRAGLGLGLMLATKYTALLSLPLFLLMLDAPHRAGWRWRNWGIVAALVLLIAGPWYVRNLLLTGNPIYPTAVSVGHLQIFKGLWTSAPSDRLRSLSGIWSTFTGGYYGMSASIGSLPIGIGTWLILAWLAAIVFSARRMLSDPMVRLAVFGPPLGIGLFILLSPYAEMRFTYPSVLLLFGAAAWVSARFSGKIGLICAAVMAISSVATAFIPAVLSNIAPFAGLAFVVMLAFVGAWIILSPRGRAGLVLVASLILCGLVYVDWKHYLAEYAYDTDKFWAEDTSYGPTGQAWAFARQNIPADATIVYANTYFVYPLYGFDLSRRVIYAPSRPGVRHLTDLPPMREKISGEQMQERIVASTVADSDREAWLANLRASGAEYLFVGKLDLAHPEESAHPPELKFAASDSGRFVPVFANDAANIYQVREMR